MWHRGSELLDSPAILRRVGIRPGWHVADLGCGSLGHFVFPAARLVGGMGKVYAVDIQRPALKAIESSARAAQLWNIHPVWGDFERPRGTTLPDEIADLTVLSNALYLAKHPEAAVAEAMRLTQPGGFVLVIEWNPDSAVLGPALDQRISERAVSDHFAAHATQWSDRFDAGEHHYALLLQKSDGNGEPTVISVSNTFE